MVRHRIGIPPRCCSRLQFVIRKFYESGVSIGADREPTRFGLTCDESNIASRNVIVANVGVPVVTRADDDGKTKLRFWVATGR